MRPILLSLTVLAMLSCAPAWAGIQVIGNSLGRECYEDTLLAPNPQRNADALAVCDRAVDDFTVSAYNRAANHVNRAEIRIRVGNFTGALDDSETALRMRPAIGVAHLNRGAALVGLERYDEALAALNQAIALGVGRPELAYFDRGLAEENLGDVRRAYFDYRKAADLDPRFEVARAQLARFTVSRPAH